MTSVNTVRTVTHASRWARYQFLSGISGLCLLATTRNLWLPGNDFPNVPLLPISHLVTHSESFEALQPATATALAVTKFACLAMMVAGLLALAVSGWMKSATTRFFVLLFPVAWLAAVLLNQHCLQPWALLLLALCMLACLPSYPTASSLSPAAPQAVSAIGTHPISWARGLVIGIYLWSALSKLDTQFAYTVGTQMMQVLFRVLPKSLVPLDPQGIAVSVLSLPLGELLVATLLALPKTRRWGAMVAIAMHSILIAVLGPWGLNHKPAVLIWNATFLCQAYLLFWPTSQAIASQAIVSYRSLSPFGRLAARLPASVIVVMLVMPTFERWGYWDHWPSWALYAPHSSRVSLAISSDAVEQLPVSLRALIVVPPPSQDSLDSLDSQDSLDEMDWVDVPLAQWSLESLEVPVYPQARFQLGVVTSLLTSQDPPRDFRVTVTSAANRWDGSRSQRSLYSLDDVFAAAGQYSLGALPLKPSLTATD